MRKNVYVQLTAGEMFYAGLVGMLRNLDAIRHNRTDDATKPLDRRWEYNIQGAMGECALAKYLNRFWLPGNELGNVPDVDGVDVRTAREEHHRLILHPQDPDERVFYLLTGYDGSYQVRGWIYGHEGKKEEYWKDPAGGRPAYFVPHHILRHPEEEPHEEDRMGP